MKRKILPYFGIFIMLVLALSACKKDVVQTPPVDPGDHNPHEPVASIKVRLQAVVTIGSITYDSIPAMFSILSWDENNVPHKRDTMLAAGVNIVNVPKSHVRFQFSVNKWGISDAMELRREQLQEDVVYTLGGAKAAKKLSREESFLFVMGNYQPSSRAHYSYNSQGLSAIDFYQKKPQSSELQYTQKHVYHYSGANVARIEVLDANNSTTGFTEFTYNEQGSKIINMHQKSYDVETYASVDHSYPAGWAAIDIDYLYNNGNALSYQMKIRGGNIVEDHAINSTGAGEGGSYQFDYNINPYAHMNMPNIFLSNLSKNNLIDQQKTFSGSIPTAVPYKYEYTYDNEGYPLAVVKHYRSYLTGEHLYKIKTVYTYV